MRENFRQEMKDMKTEVLSIGRAVVERTADSVAALVAGDVDLADRVIAGDDEIDRRTLAVEEHSLEVIATQFPVARDLRLLHSLTYIGMHMERMGDLAVNIAKSAKRTARDTKYLRSASGRHCSSSRAMINEMRLIREAGLLGDGAEQPPRYYTHSAGSNA